MIIETPDGPGTIRGDSNRLGGSKKFIIQLMDGRIRRYSMLHSLVIVLVLIANIFLVCFWIVTVVLTFWHREVFHWFTHQFQKQKVKKSIHKVLVEHRADCDALAFALAVSEIRSKDLYAASDVHPAIKDRFEKKEKEKIAEQAFLLRKDEHDEFYFDSENVGTKLHRVLLEERRRSYDVPPPPPLPPNPLIRELRRSLREMAERMERQRTEQVVQESPGQTPETLLKPKKKGFKSK